MAQARCEISVVIPAYNEGERIAKTLRVTEKTLDGLGCSYEIIVVDDGSPDDTARVVKGFIASNKKKTSVSLITYNPNQGKGFALKRGALAARGRYIAFFDADLDISADHIIRYYHLIREQQADVVVASKRHPDSVLEYAKSRKIISNIYYLFNRLFFRLRVKDTQSGMKMFRREALLQVLPVLLVKRFAFDLELLVNLAKKKAVILEASMTISGHTGYGRFGFRPLWHAFVDTMAILFRFYILRYYDWPLLPGPGKKKKCTLFIFSTAYTERLVALVSFLNESFATITEIVILSEKGGFTVSGAKVLETGEVSLSGMLWAGLNRTRSPLVGIISADTLPSPGWLLPLSGYFSQESVSALAGPVQLYTAGGYWQRVFSLFNKNIFLRGRRGQAFRLRRQQFVETLPLVNSFFRREALVACLNTPGSLYADDCGDYWMRLAEKGLFTPDLAVQKFVSARPFRERFLQIYHTRFGSGYQLAKKGRISFRVLLPSFLLVFLLIALTFSFLSAVFGGFFAASFSLFFLLVYLSTGRLIAIWYSIPAGLAVLAAGILRGFAVLKGVFTRTPAEDKKAGSSKS